MPYEKNYPMPNYTMGLPTAPTGYPGYQLPYHHQVDQVIQVIDHRRIIHHNMEVQVRVILQLALLLANLVQGMEHQRNRQIQLRTEHAQNLRGMDNRQLVVVCITYTNQTRKRNVSTKYI